MLNRDTLNHLSVRDAATGTMAVIDAIQDMTPERQTIAIAAAFKLLMEKHKLSPQDAFTVADNIMNHADGRRVEFDAVRAYLEHEL
jgi:hypothetical protein